MPYGSDATPPELEDYFWYEFTGWDGDYTNVTENITITATYRMLGDIDEDGEVTTADAIIILRFSMGIITEINADIADINSNGTIDIMDALMILRHALGVI